METSEEVPVGIDVNEWGGEREGRRQVLNKRLFVQLQVYGGCSEPQKLAAALSSAGFASVLYQDANDPKGVGLLTMSDDPLFFVTRLRETLVSDVFQSLAHKTEFTMFGRTYASGYESNLEDWLLRRPRRTVLDPACPWAIWYPLRRNGAFAQLSAKEQGAILREHAAIGRAYGEAGLAHDVRLACHGLDARDNEFVIGLIGPDLHPLSHVIQSMRRTRQTAQYIQAMGPFFVGYSIWRSEP